MKNSKGFKKLKGMASVGAMSIASVFGMGSVRAGGSTVSTGFFITTGSARWGDFGNNSSFPSTRNITTTNGDFYSMSTTAFCYSDAKVTITVSGTGTETFSDAFDCAMILAVEGNLFINPDSTVDLSGNTVTSDVVSDITPAIDAQVQYRVYTDRRLIRGLFTLTNTGPGPIFLNAAIMGDYGSDDSTTVLATSDLDNTIEGTDLWFITDEDTASGGNDPIVTTTRYGVDAEVVPFNAFTPSSNDAVYAMRYPIDIPAGATVRIMTFHEIAPADLALLPALVAAAKDFESMTAVDSAGLIDDLGQSVRDSIVNYGDSDIIFKNGFE